MATAEAKTEMTAAETVIVPPKFLTFDEIIAANDCPWEAIEVPEWGGSVRVRKLSFADQEAFVKAMFQIQDGTTKIIGDSHHARYLSICICNEKGERIFTEEHVAALAAKNYTVVKRLFDEAQRVNGARTKDIEEIEKNFLKTISV